MYYINLNYVYGKGKTNEFSNSMIVLKYTICDALMHATLFNVTKYKMEYGQYM